MPSSILDPYLPPSLRQRHGVVIRYEGRPRGYPPAVFASNRESGPAAVAVCVSYALARSRGLPLLYKGTDFAKTDVISASG